MIGFKVGKLLVIEYSHSDGNNHHWKCICDCGRYRITSGTNLRLKRVLRCNECKRITHIKHGKKNSTEYNIWNGILARCTNPNNKAYCNYGGRGITVSKSWLKFANFYKDMGDRPKKMQIDRIDNNKGYYKENCRWTTPQINSNNRRSSGRSIPNNNPKQISTS